MGVWYVHRLVRNVSVVRHSLSDTRPSGSLALVSGHASNARPVRQLFFGIAQLTGLIAQFFQASPMLPDLLAAGSVRETSVCGRFPANCFTIVISPAVFQFGQMSGEVAIGQSCDLRQEGKVRRAAYSFAATVSPIVIGAPSISASSLTITALQK